LLILLSGPEPQRTRLEKILLEQVHSLPCSVVILQGLPQKQEIRKIGPLHTMVSHLPSTVMKQLMANASFIICRAGYTSIMDLAVMRKKAMIIPTPGQTEQEYLTDYLSRNRVFLACAQRDLNLPAALAMLEKFNPIFSFPNEELMGEQLEGLDQ
jgi:UDP-N-acetylglucosamine:LPS N-acetylglucosamine transferase